MTNRELNQRLLELAREYARIAAQLLGDNLVSVVLFGSVARGEAHERSDIDLLVIFDQLTKGAFKRRAVLEPVRARLTPKLEQLWRQGIYADFVEIIHTKDEAREPRLYYLDMTEDAVVLFDKDKFFSQVLGNLRAKLKSLGSQRRTIGKTRYWDLKPDFRPGETVEL